MYVLRDPEMSLSTLRAARLVADIYSVAAPRLTSDWTPPPFSNSNYNFLLRVTTGAALEAPKGMTDKLSKGPISQQIRG